MTTRRPSRSSKSCVNRLPRSANDELNDRSLEECEHHAVRYDFAWNECQSQYDNDVWWGFNTLADWADYLNYEGLSCDGDGDDASSCAITEPQHPPAWALLLIALFGLRARPSTRSRER